MRIWWINQFALPPTAAGGTRHYSLARGLVEQGHEVVVFTSTTSYMVRDTVTGGVARTRQDHDGVRFEFLPVLPGAGFVGRLREMFDFAERMDAEVRRSRRRLDGSVPIPDLVIGSTPAPPAALAGRAAARRLRVPFFLEVRDIWPESLIQLGRYPSWHPVMQTLAWMQRRLLADARGAISILPNAVPYFRGMGLAEADVCLLPNGVDLSLVPAVRPLPPRAAGEPLVCMYAGSHNVANDLMTLLDAIARVQAQAPGSVRWVFVGDGPSKPALRQRAEALGLRDVEFRDPVPKAAIYDVLAEAHVLLMPLKAVEVYQFGISPNKLWDYLAVGRPVIFGLTAANDPVRQSSAGRSVAPEDPAALAAAVLDLVDLPDAALRELGSAGRAYVEREHDLSKLARRLEQFLSERSRAPA